MDGSKKYVEFSQQKGDDYTRSLRLKELLVGRHLVVEAEGALLVFPFENIKYVQAYPAPKQLPEYVIRVASFKD